LGIFSLGVPAITFESFVTLHIFVSVCWAQIFATVADTYYWYFLSVY
jgi:hypothetical protein